MPDRNLGQWLTCIVTTSPTQSNPGTSMIKWLFKSFEQIEGLDQVEKIIVCDGCRVRSPEPSANKSKKGYRSGWVSPKGLEDYETYKQKVRELCQTGEGAWARTRVMELETRHGFGFAVEAALADIQTELVLVIQHDRFFLRRLDLHKVVVTIRKESRIKSLYLATHNTSDYVSRMRSRLQVDIQPLALRVEGLQVLPMLVWLDSTHIARTAWYKGFVFEPRNMLVAKGGFIEDKFGQVQLRRFKERGLESHGDFGTYILPEADEVEQLASHPFAKRLIEEGCILPVEERVPWVRHINGRTFLELSQRLKKIEIHDEAPASD